MKETPLKIGILGGGQLGKMLLQVAPNYPIEVFVLENDADCPAAQLCHSFTKGDITDFDTVLQFGRNADVITIEIEHVNTSALFELEKEGKTIIPSPSALAIIQNKGKQKDFYAKNQIPTTPFFHINSKAELLSKTSNFPFVQKLHEGGYDGKGVIIIENENELSAVFDAASVIEEKAAIAKEIAIIVAVGQNGEISTYPPTEMIFNQELNLVDYLISPADLSEEEIAIGNDIAIATVKALNSPGIFAVEFFYTIDGQWLVNEIAPRAHNSGHHTIEGNFCSQYDMQLRIYQNLPLGNTAFTFPSAMINILGEENYTGSAYYPLLTKWMQIENAYLHLYGKKTSKPGRKMGHITFLASSIEQLHSKIAAFKAIK